MKIAFYKMGLQNPIVNTQFSGMYTDFFAALSKYKNTRVELINHLDKVNMFDYLVVPMGDGQEQDSCKAMAKFKGPVILYVQPAHNWFKKSLLLRWKRNIAFVYGTDVSDYSPTMYQSIGMQYLHMPFASNSSVFYPLVMPKIYDVIFVGNSDSGSGRLAYIRALLKKAKNKGWKVMLLGSGWENLGFPRSSIPHGSVLNLLYNSAKVCINVSNHEQILGKQKCLDANNRLFDIAMSGSCQVSNGTQLIRHYFSYSEVPTAESIPQWLELIENCLLSSKKRTILAKRSQKKAKAFHTWDNRAEDFLHMLKIAKPSWKQSLTTENTVSLRLLDMYLPPIDFYYRIGMRTVDKFLKKYVITQ